MKISKIFTSLVVCGALIFPGALSSSAQENDSSESAQSVNYSTVQETDLLINSESSRVAPHLNISKPFPTYRGESFFYTVPWDQGPPYAPVYYSGTIFFNSSKSTTKSYWYEGILYL